MTTIKNQLTVLTFLVLFVSGSALYGQGKMNRHQDHNCNHGKKDHKCEILDLTEDQEAKIEKLRTEHQKKMLPMQNEMGEKKAHLRTVSTGENVDMAKVNKTIDEIAALKTKMMKESAAHKQAVRKELTEEQRLKFDKMHMHKCSGQNHRGYDNKKHGYKHGDGHCKGMKK